MFCAKCRGTEIRKLSLVYESGLSFSEGTVAGVGFGGAGPGIGLGAMKGKQISALAARAAPPKKEDVAYPVALAIVSLIFVLVSVWWWIGVVVGVLAAAGSITHNKTKWPQLMSQWDAMYMCGRCGFIGLPAMDQRMESGSLHDARLAGPGKSELPP